MRAKIVAAGALLAVIAGVAPASTGAASASGGAVTAPAAPTAPVPCEGLTPAERLVVDCVWGTDPEEPPDPDNPGEPPPDNEPIPDGVHCRWRAAYGSYVTEYLDNLFPEVPEGKVVAAKECAYFKDGATLTRDEVVDLMGYDWYAENLGLGGAPLPGPVLDPAWNFTGEFALVDEDQVSGPPSPEMVAQMLRLRLEANLTVPEVAADPPCAPGDPMECDPAVVDIPTFVEVTNWPENGEIVESGCEQGVCVEIVATPSLHFQPGEPGADEIDCAGSGSRYNPDGGSPSAQADVDGACAHAYSQRTGAGGEPGAWSARVEITWVAEWTGPGDSGGTFDDIDPTGTDMLRPVEEVQTIVSDAQLG